LIAKTACHASTSSRNGATEERDFTTATLRPDLLKTLFLRFSSVSSSMAHAIAIPTAIPATPRLCVKIPRRTEAVQTSILKSLAVDFFISPHCFQHYSLVA
jgi:hypothetical protein